MEMADREERARGSFERRLWGDAFTDLSAAHREGELAAEGLERLAAAAYMVGRDDDCEDAWTAAHHAWLRRGETEPLANSKSPWQPGLSIERRWRRRESCLRDTSGSRSASSFR